VCEIEKIGFTLCLKLISNVVELTNDHIHLLEVKLCQSIKLLNVGKHFYQLLQSLYKLVEFVENLSLGKIECFAFGHVSHFLFGSLVGFFILSVEFNATAKDFNNFRWVSFPDIFYFASWRNDFFSAVFNHLIGNFNEQASHLVRSVVKSSNCMNHLYRIH